jgi:aspartyl-tRNA(Asn)/glutamyl-tRNA(Gln) amidotransferase subunit A
MSQRLSFSLSAAEMAVAFASGALDPVRVCLDLLDAIESDAGGLNAFVLIDREAALHDAQLSAARHRAGCALGPLDGVPVSIKDLINVKGWPTRRGSLASSDAPALQDAPAVALLRQAGAVLFGKTTTTEFGCIARGDNPLTGLTRNPRDANRSPGGSSSGAAAQIAAGWGPLALGSDAGGSVRIPASWCGIVAFKPTFANVPLAPVSAFAEFAHLGPMARTVQDCAVAMSVLGRPHVLDQASLFTRQPSDAKLKPLRVGWCTRIGPDAGLDPEIASAFMTLVTKLQGSPSLAMSVQPIDLTYFDLANDMWRVWSSRVHESFIDWAPTQREVLGPDVRALIEIGAATSIEELARSRARLRSGADRLSSIFTQVDILITPTTACVAPLPLEIASATHPHFAAVQASGNWLAGAPYTWPFNLTQQPALSLPLGCDIAGLPFGVQLVGRRFNDDAVLDFGASIEYLLSQDAI